jgi:hypothetical protein
MKVKSLFFALLVLLMTSIGVQAQTLCEVSIPYSEGFEGGVLPNCWTQVAEVSDGEWTVDYGDGNVAPHTGNFNAYIEVNSYNPNITKLISPAFNLSSLTNPQLDFWYINRAWGNDKDTLRVYYRTSSTGTWQQVFETDGDHSTWTEQFITLPTTATQVAFEMSGHWGHGVGIDDVTIGEPSNCFPVTNLTATATENSVTLSWTDANNSGATYTVKNMITGSIIVSGLTNTSYTVNGLTSATLYTFGVQAQCSPTEASGFNSVYTQTAMAVANIPFNTGFETGDDNNWLFANGTNGWVIGSATNNGGGRSMYISDDGGTTCAYDQYATTSSYAYKAFNFTTNEYTLRFDWKGTGEGNCDYLRVFAVPAGILFVADQTNNIGSNGAPEGWIALDGGNRLSGGSAWQTVQSTFTPTHAGTYYLVFYWCNDFSVGGNPAAIDNVSISVYIPSACAKPLPYSYGFEDANELNCWTVISDQTNTGIIDGTVSYTSLGRTHCFKFFAGNTLQALISPELTGTANGVFVSFSFSQIHGADFFDVGYSTTTSDLSSFTWIPAEENGSQSIQYYSHTFPAGTRYVAVRYDPDYQYGLYLDDFKFEVPPTCHPVTFLQALPSYNNMTVFWNDNANTSATTYTVYDMSDNSVVASGVSAHQYIVQGLNSFTDYTYGVRANCSATDSSEIVTIERRTYCDPYNIPYIDDMWSELECWTTMTYNSNNFTEFTSYNGHTILAFNSYNIAENGSTNYNQYGYSPLIDASSATGNVPLRITYSTYGSSDPLYFGYSTTASMNFSDYTWAGPFSTNGYNDWAIYQVEIPNTVAQLAIHYAPTGNYNRAFVDHIELGDASVLCTTSPVPYYEDFEGIPATNVVVAGNLPNCWNAYSSSTSPAPHVTADPTWSYQESGLNSLVLDADDGATQYALLPSMSAPLNQLQLSFWMCTDEVIGTLTVGYVTSDDYTTFIPIQSYAASEETVHNGAGVQPQGVGYRYVLDLNGLPLTATRLAFKWEATTWVGCCIDNIYISYIPNTNECTVPTEVSYESWSDQIDLVWQDVNANTTFSLLKLSSDFSTLELVASGITANAEGYASYTVTGLSPNTEYAFLLTAYCTQEGDTLFFTASTDYASDTYYTVCEPPYVWHGTAYSSTGNYQSRNDILHLTVLGASSSDTTVCVPVSFEWHGVVYAASGDYTWITYGENGCDSIITLHLTIGNDCCTATIPYNEGFEGYDAVDYFGSGYLDELPLPLPECWDGTITSDLSNDPTSTTYGNTIYYKPHVVTNDINTGAFLPLCWSGGTQSLELVAASNSSTYALFPPMNVPLNQLQMQFWFGTNYYATGTGILTIGYVTDDNPNTFVSLQTYQATEATLAAYLSSPDCPGGMNVTLNLRNLPSTATRLAFKWENTTDNTTAMEEHPLCFIDDINIDISSCEVLRNLQASDIGGDYVTLSWEDPTNGEISYDLLQITNENTLEEITSGIFAGSDGYATYTIPGLTPATDYEFLVVGSCEANLTDTFNIPVTTTACVIVSLPYSTDLEGEMGISLFTDAVVGGGCYTRIDDAHSDPFDKMPYVGHLSGNAHSGNRYLEWNHGGGYADFQIMSLPKVNTNLYPINTLSFSFWTIAAMRWTETLYPQFIVGVMTDPNDASTFVPVDTIEEARYTEWTEVVVDLASYSGTGSYVAIKGVSGGGRWYAYLDDISLFETTCHPVENLIVSDISSRSATLTWDNNNVNATYTIYSLADSIYHEYNSLYCYANNTVLETGITGNTYTATGLAQNTVYRFGVIANCSTTDKSVMVCVNGTTPAACDAVHDLYVLDVWSDQVDLHWTDPTNGSISYTLLQSTSDPSHPYDVIGTGLHADNNGVVTYTIPNLVPGISYTFAVVGSCTRSMTDTVEIVIVTESTAVHNESACQIPYEWHGVEYYVPGEYYSRNDTLNLDILVGDTTATACESFDWYDQHGLTASGDYTHTLTAASGCDSVVTLHLTINHGIYNAYDTTVCESYEWHDSTYTASGTYIYEYLSATGCTNVDTLHLIVNACCSPVENLAVDSVSETTVSLSWTGAAASYTVTNGIAEVATEITDTHYTVSGLTAATNYIFSVIANCSSTSSSIPVTISATTNTSSSGSDTLVNVIVVPNDPAMCLYIQGNGSYHVGDTAFLAAVANEGFYFVNWEYNNTVLSTENPFKMIVTLDLTDTIYAIFDATSCEPVINLDYSDTTSTSVHLVWEDPNNSGATYAVGYYDGDDIVIVETGIVATNYNVTGLTPGTTYYLVVRTDCSESIMVYSMPLVITMPLYDAITTYDESSEWILYPNPTSDKINVQLTMNGEQLRNVEVQLYDMYGKWLNSWKVSSETTEIDLSSYAASVYFIKVVDEQHLLGVRKIVKQ